MYIFKKKNMIGQSCYLSWLAKLSLKENSWILCLKSLLEMKSRHWYKHNLRQQEFAENA